MSELSDQVLVERCLQGDQRAWALLVERYERLVFSIARTEGLDSAEAEDLTQSVFLELVRSLRTLQDIGRLASWLGTVSRRHAWRLRNARRRYDVVAPGDDDLDSVEPAGPIDRSADLVSLMSALDELGDRCRRLLIKLYLSESEPSYESISEDLDMPIGSIGPTRARCLEKLRVELEQDEHYDPVTYRGPGIRL